MRRAGPRTLETTLASLLGELRPATPLARVQAVWQEAVGERVAREATPVSERDGVLTVACSSSLWAHELELMATDLAARIEAAAGPGTARSLRFVVRA